MKCIYDVYVTSCAEQHTLAVCFGVGKDGIITLDQTIEFVLDISGSHSSMMFCWVVFCCVISMIVDAFVPKETELLLCESIS